MTDFSAKLSCILKNIRLSKPVVHHITNFVTINDCANITTALGASPVMAYNKDEVGEMTALSNALVLNLGTPDFSRFDTVTLSGKTANQLSIPVILDPVGIGATSFRQNGIKHLLNQVSPSVIKGKASEIKTLTGLVISKNKVIDSEESMDTANIEVIKSFALSLNAVVAITGKVDYITNGTQLIKINRGTEMFTYISGAGCITSSVIGAFCAVEKDTLLATVCAIYAVNICGEKAAKECNGPADFKIKLINALYALHSEEIMEKEIYFE
ncbi:MAG: hydroxyethylthiazole kinase [Lachnospiraceae bacterium]|nr:hydroxyethylthiazole kinase [Lachnospiraceae bacterium]